MIRVKAIRKIGKQATIYAAPGETIGYTLQDEYGNLRDVRKSELKAAIAQGKIEVINITLTSDNRLVYRDLDKLSQKQLNKFNLKVSTESKNLADNLELMSNMIYENTLYQYIPTNNGLTLYKAKQKTNERTSGIKLDFNIDFFLPPEVKMVYDDAFKNLRVAQSESDPPLDYSNVEYIGRFGIPDINSGFIPLRVKMNKHLKYLGNQIYLNLHFDYLNISNELKLFHNQLPEHLCIDRLDVTREDCSNICIYTKESFGIVNIHSSVKSMEKRSTEDNDISIKDTETTATSRCDELFCEELHISEQSGITKHNSFRYTKMRPYKLDKFKLKVLDVPEEIFDDIVTDSLKYIRPDYDFMFQYNRNTHTKDGQQVMTDKIIANIKQIAIAYKAGTGRGLTESQKKKFISAIKRCEKMKQKKL